VDGGQGGEREQSSMESWNEIMYSELRRRGAVNSNELAPPPPVGCQGEFWKCSPENWCFNHIPCACMNSSRHEEF
jgi:hypothetical protein